VSLLQGPEALPDVSPTAIGRTKRATARSLATKGSAFAATGKRIRTLGVLS